MQLRFQTSSPALQSSYTTGYYYYWIPLSAAMTFGGSCKPRSSQSFCVSHCDQLWLEISLGSTPLEIRSSRYCSVNSSKSLDFEYLPPHYSKIRPIEFYLTLPAWLYKSKVFLGMHLMKSKSFGTTPFVFSTLLSKSALSTSSHASRLTRA